MARYVWLCVILYVLTMVGMVLGAEPVSTVTADQALATLKEGNARFVADKPVHPHADAVRRHETSTGQHPIATILGCSDSRVPPERLFDCGVGDIFIVRVAGNVVATDEAGSIEYGIGHLNTPLLVVLGHTSCGAVTAVATNAEVGGNILPLVSPIKPAVERTRKEYPALAGKEFVAAAIKANVWQGIEDLLARSPEAREKIKEGKLKVVGAIYDIATGQVQWLGAHPEEEKLIEAAEKAVAARAEAETVKKTADQALASLKEGNARFAAGKSVHPHTDAARLNETSAKGQHPIATILGCSDSREPPERLFDCGVGDIFIVRVAGNVCATDEAGSIEYGVGHLDTPLLVVLGHTSCGAVTAVVTDAKVGGNIAPLVSPIKPGVERTRKAYPSLSGKELIAEAIKANVWQSIEDLVSRSAEVREKIKDGKLKVVGAVYDIATGQVQWLGAHPEEAKLLVAAEQNSEKAEAEGATKTAAATVAAFGHKDAGRVFYWLFGLAVLALALGLTWFFARSTDARGEVSLRWTFGSKMAAGGSVLVILLAAACLGVGLVLARTSLWDAWRTWFMAGSVAAVLVAFGVLVLLIQTTRRSVRDVIGIFNARAARMVAGSTTGPRAVRSSAPTRRAAETAVVAGARN